MKKLNSLYKLNSLGFNTPIFIPIYKRSDLIKNIDQIKLLSPLSIRSDHPTKDGIVFPFFPDQSFENALIHIEEILDKGLIAIVQKSVNPKESSIAGKYLKYENYGIIEYFIGVGTIREEMEGLNNNLRYVECNDRKILNRFITPDIEPFITDINSQIIRDTWCLISPCCIEWAIYPYEIGMLNKKIIFWETYKLK